MSHDFDRSKFELIDAVIENQGDLPSNQIPKSLDTVIRTIEPSAENTKSNTPKSREEK